MFLSLTVSLTPSVLSFFPFSLPPPLPEERAHRPLVAEAEAAAAEIVRDGGRENGGGGHGRRDHRRLWGTPLPHTHGLD